MSIAKRLEAVGKARAEEHRRINGPGSGYSYEKGHAELSALMVELAEALERYRNFMIGCKEAAHSNMEGADEQDFLYWNTWAAQCSMEAESAGKPLAKLEAYLATYGEGGKNEKARKAYRSQ